MLVTIKLPTLIKAHKSVRSLLKDYYQIPSRKEYTRLEKKGESIITGDVSDLNLETIKKNILKEPMWGFVDTNNIFHAWSNKPMFLKQIEALTIMVKVFSCGKKSYVLLDGPKKYSTLVTCLNRKSYEFTKIKRRKSECKILKKEVQ